MMRNASQQIMQQTSINGEILAGMDTIRTQEDYQMKAMALSRYTKTLLIPEEELMTALNASIESNEYNARNGTAFVEGMEDQEQEMHEGGKVVKKPVLSGLAVAGGKKKAYEKDGRVSQLSNEDNVIGLERKLYRPVYSVRPNQHTVQ